MLVAFFESVKYVGHLLPVAFLRVYLGYYFTDLALEQWGSDQFTYPWLWAEIEKWLPYAIAPAWYVDLVTAWVRPYWEVFVYVAVVVKLVIGVSFLLGFLVRPASLLGFFMFLNMIYLGAGYQNDFPHLMLALFFTLFWLGAGRSLGLDYFFFKRQRGLWW